MEQTILSYLLQCIADRPGSLRELSEATGVPYHTLTKIAQGQTVPRLETAEKLLRYFSPPWGAWSMPARTTPMSNAELLATAVLREARCKPAR